MKTPSHGELVNRRAFLCRTGATVGTAALAGLLGQRHWLTAASPVDGLPKDAKWPGIVRPVHHAPKIKRIIQLYMAGGPSQLETFDHKPTLAKRHGQLMPKFLTIGQPSALLQGAQELRCMAPQWELKQAGRSGQFISEIFPRLTGVVDELCVIRSMHTEAINHDPANTYMNTGSLISGRPSVGSWINYGLGSESENLPGFIVLTSTGKQGNFQPLSNRQWHSGFLPGEFQGVHLRSQGEPVLYVKNPPGVPTEHQRDVVTTVQEMDRLRHRVVDDPEIITRIAQYELAFRMQTSVPGLTDLSSESKAVLDLYGVKPGEGSFAANCLIARRLAERGVRYIQLYHREWDHHTSVKVNVQKTAAEVDQGMAGLLTDLKRLGLLQDTLVMWNGEFGRSPMAQSDGRDHHQRGFSIWLAGGGVKAGLSYGATDDFGYYAVKDPVHVNDLHATVLHLLGIDHRRLTFAFQGREFRLTDVAGEVVKGILA